MIRAVIFDFDGVLANSEPLHFRAFRDVLATRGITLSERAYYERYLGFDDVGAFQAISHDAGAPFDGKTITALVAEKAGHLEALEREGSVLFPGARDAVMRMAAFGPIAIASGALRGEIERVLVREQLAAMFPVIVAAEDTPSSKPDPAPYRLAVERLGHHAGITLAPEECVAVEDSRWGLVSARDAGLHTIGITHSYPAEELQSAADSLIAHLDQLDAHLLHRL
ncbi:MAG: HAD family phosphatase [Acidobacteriaceae bacterium]|jgi:beta-phosphoglucomutase|nr:HAD family phosphatase [Acidobacteriaceae bacterium]